MAEFRNPNNPIQPQKGVYGWFASKDNHKLTIYIGEAGKRESLPRKGTLFRGISELQRNTFTSNSPDYNKLDTDFIVGTAIKFFEGKGFSCYWKHIDDDPHREKEFVAKEKPIIQNEHNARIKEEFRVYKSEKNYWKSRYDAEGMREAEIGIFKQLESLLPTLK